MSDRMLRTPHELFAHRLRTMLWVEQKLAGELLPLVQEHVRSTDLRYVVEHHLLETRAHCTTLERVLRLLVEPDDPEPSPALAGLEAEHAALMQLVDENEGAVADLVYAGVLAAGEHLELAAYESLVATANALGEEDVAAMLEEIREQEAYALELVNAASAKLLAERVSSGLDA